MSIWSRIRSLFVEHGVYGIGQKLTGLLADHYFEKIHRLDTAATIRLSDLNIDAVNISNATSHYEASRLLPICFLLRSVTALLDSPVGLVDCGAGKGKVLLVGMKEELLESKCRVLVVTL